MLSPVDLGREPMEVRVSVSLKAMVVLAASVQLQNAPFCSVLGLPGCEHGAQAPLLLSQCVRAIHGWSRNCQSFSLSLSSDVSRHIGRLFFVRSHPGHLASTAFSRKDRGKDIPNSFFGQDGSLYSGSVQPAR